MQLHRMTRKAHHIHARFPVGLTRRQGSGHGATEAAMTAHQSLRQTAAFNSLLQSPRGRARRLATRLTLMPIKTALAPSVARIQVIRTQALARTPRRQLALRQWRQVLVRAHAPPTSASPPMCLGVRFRLASASAWCAGSPSNARLAGLAGG